MLEMERIHNHVADFGMIANDTGFAFGHAQCFRLRERLMRLNKRLTGNRLLRGGVTPDVSREGQSPVVHQLARALFGAAQKHRAGLPALQQVIQSVLFRQ
jgi:Ni,Fe-hydrogenase III large subunit